MYDTHDRDVALVTGASGTVGRDVVRLLGEHGVPVRAASRSGSPAFDLTDPATWPAALGGVDRLFLVRPPAVHAVRRDVVPFLEAARSAGVRHVVLLSVQGADRLPVTPHARLEAWLRGSGLDWTFVRPSFFVQNLTGVHAADVVRGRLVLPAGRGRTAFVDSTDVARVAAAALADPAAYRQRALTPTGPEALTYDEVATALTDVLGRPVRYVPASLLRYARHAHRTLGLPWPMVAVTAGIYTTARLGLAAGLTDDVRAVTGRPPASLRDVAERERAAWAADAGTGARP
jgi:uncharacterized protein YbjT (DUF2867 family)